MLLVRIDNNYFLKYVLFKNILKKKLKILKNSFWTTKTKHSNHAWYTILSFSKVKLIAYCHSESLVQIKCHFLDPPWEVLCSLQWFYFLGVFRHQLPLWFGSKRDEHHHHHRHHARPQQSNLILNCYLRQLFCYEYVSLLLPQHGHSIKSMAEPHARQSAVYVIKYFHWRRRSGWTRYLLKLFLLVSL